MPLFRRRQQREQQARGATPALQPSVARRGMFRGRPNEITLTVDRRDGGSLRRNIDTGAQRVVYPEQPIPSPSDAIVPERGNYLSGQANLRMNPRTGYQQMQYIDGVEMTPARRSFQRGMNELLKGQTRQGNPELAQGYFERAYRQGQAEGLTGPEMDMIQQKAQDQGSVNMSLRAGRMIPYFADQRDPETGMFISPEDRSDSVPAPRNAMEKDLISGVRERNVQGALNARSQFPLDKALEQERLRRQYEAEAEARIAAGDFSGPPPLGSPPQAAPPAPPQAAPPAPPQAPPQAPPSAAPPVPPPAAAPQGQQSGGVTFNNAEQRMNQPIDAQAQYDARQQLKAQIQAQRVAAQGDPAVNSLGVQPAPPPVGTQSLIQVDPRTGMSKVAFNTYRSADGRFTANAKVLGIEGSDVLMEYDDGRRNRVPLNMLDRTSQDQAIRTNAIKQFGRGPNARQSVMGGFGQGDDYFAYSQPQSRSQSLNQLFGTRDRNELYSSVTGELTSGSPQAYREQQAFNSAFGMAPPENPEIDEALVAQAARNARNREAQIRQPGALPDLPDPNPNEPLLSPRGQGTYNPDDARNRRAFVPLPDRDVGQMYGNERSNVNVRTVMDPDGTLRNVVSGANTAIDDNGNIVLVERRDDGTMDAAQVVGADGSTAPIAFSQNSNLIGGSRSFTLDQNGNMVPGTGTSESSTVRREREQDAKIALGNSPNATPEQRLAGAEAQRNQTLNREYRERLDQRQQDAVDLNAAAAQLRGYGQGRMSRTEAIGQVQSKREAQKRLDDEMKRQRDVEDRRLKIEEDEAANRRAQSEIQAKRLDMEMQAQQGELDLMKREQRLAKSPAGPDFMFAGNTDPEQRYNGIVSIMNGVDSATGKPLSGSDQRWYLQNQFGITTKRQLIDAADAAGYSPPDRTTWSDIFTFDWFQSYETDQSWNENIGSRIEDNDILPGGTEGTLPDKPRSGGVGSRGSSGTGKPNSRNSQNSNRFDRTQMGQR